MKKLLLVFFTVIGLTGCTTRYTITDAAPLLTGKLDRDQPVYLAVSQDGSYRDSITYKGSGLTTTASLQAALAPYASAIFIAPGHEEEHVAIESAKRKEARYVFVPDLTNWVHRRAAASLRASGVSLTVAVFDLAREGDDKRIMFKNLRVQGRNLTWRSQFPEEILKPLLVRFARTIY